MYLNCAAMMIKNVELRIVEFNYLVNMSRQLPVVVFLQ